MPVEKDNNNINSKTENNIIINSDWKSAIDKEVAQIQAAKYRRYDHVLMGGGRSFFFNNKNELRQIKASILMSAATLETDYYIQDGALIYVDRLHTDYKRSDSEGNAYKELAKMYFQNGKMLSYTIEQAHETTEEFLKEMEARILNEFEAFVQEAKGK